LILRAPPRLSPGDRVAVVAPSGPVPRERFEAGLLALGDRYRVCFDEGLHARAGFLAGSDARRLGELTAALSDPSIRAVLCARGGHGLTRLLGSLTPALLTADPKPIVGFSDVTALHFACLVAGLRSVHGPVVAQLARLDDPTAAVADVAARLESPDPPPPWSGLRTLAGGPPVTGRALGGNLELVTRLLGTPWSPAFDGAVLFLEEVHERPYRLDRQLTHLALAGVLARVAGVVVGDLVGCDDEGGPGGAIRGDDVVAERLSGLRVPVLTGAPFGHGGRNRAFVHGGRVRLDAGRGVVEFLDGAVS
jgi:muramoyltetrapeptide carboxypeptidase